MTPGPKNMQQTEGKIPHFVGSPPKEQINNLAAGGLELMVSTYRVWLLRPHKLPIFLLASH